jgi:hypothetical protein
LSVNVSKKGELQGSLNTGNFGPAMKHPMQFLTKLLLDGTLEGVSDRPLVKQCLLAAFTVSRTLLMAWWYGILQAVHH